MPASKPYKKAREFELEAEIERLQAENDRLRAEIDGLTGLLATSAVPIGKPKPVAHIVHPDVRP